MQHKPFKALPHTRSQEMNHKERPHSHVTRHTPFEELPQFLSVEEFRTFVGLGRSTVYDLLRREEIACVRFGRVVRIPKSALRAYMEVNDEQK